MKKIISLILIFVIVFSSTIAVAAANCGDINGDGDVTATDAVVLGRYLANWSGYRDISTENAYIDDDDKITSKDLVVLFRHLAGWTGYENLSGETEPYNYKVFTAKELYDIMPVQETGTLADDKSYVRFTGGDIAFCINDLDQFDVSEYKYMVVGARASEANGNAVPANAYMWYNNDPTAVGVRYGFSSSFGQCWSWTSKNIITETDVFTKLNFTVTDAKREDNKTKDIDYSRGMSSLVLKPYTSGKGMLTEGSTFDVQYVAFFKTSAEAESFDYSKLVPSRIPPRSPYDRGDTRPVVVLKFDDLGRASYNKNFDRVAQILEERNITGSFGTISYRFEDEANAAVVPYVKKWDKQGIEFWSHGYAHTEEEFSTDPYDTQLESLKKALDVIKEMTGVEIKSFGSPYGGKSRDTLIMVKDHFPEMNTFFQGYLDDNVSSVYHLTKPCGIEVGVGVTDINRFLFEYTYQKLNSHIYIQSHPGQWKEADFENFEKMLDHLIADGCTFMTPSQAAADYYARKPIEVRVENEYAKLSTFPVIQNNIIFVPFADVAEALGATVKTSTSLITAAKDDLKIVFTGTAAQINGSAVTFESAPITVDGTILVPLSFVSDAFDAFAHWDADTKTVTLIPNLGKQELHETGLEIVKATYDDYQKDPVMLGEFSFDGNIDTAWYCEGKTDREIVYELKEVSDVEKAAIIWKAQSAPFEIYTSTDNVSFTLAAEGTSPEAVGTTQTVDINKEAKYVKVVTKYNGVNYDHGIAEISFNPSENTVQNYYDYKVFTAEELYSIMPAQDSGDLSDDGSYIRFTGGEVTFSINDIDQFDMSTYRYMVVGARADEANGNTVPAFAYMWYNDNPALGARYDFTSSFGYCRTWYSKNTITKTGDFEKLNFIVTEARRLDDSTKNIGYSHGMTSLILSPYLSSKGILTEGQTFDVQYVAFFKTEAEAASFNYAEFNPDMASPATPMAKIEQSPVVILKFDDLGNPAKLNGFIRVADILIERELPGTFGIIAKNLAGSSSKIATVCEKITEWSNQNIEMWSHGYDHSEAEFSTAPYDTQYESFKKALDTVKEKTGVEIKSFCSPYGNATRDTLIMIKDNFPQITSVFNGAVDLNVSNLYHLDNHCKIEIKSGVTDYNHFLMQYSQQKYNSHIYVQMHPANYTDADIENFEKMLDFLVAEGCTFMTPSQAVADHYARKPVEVRIENEYITLNTNPVTRDGVVFVPFTDVAEALDAAVLEGADTIIAEKGDLSINITGDTAQINGAPASLEAAPITSGGKMLVPVSFISEAFDVFAHWETDTKIVTLLPKLGKQELGENSVEIVKATYGDYQKDPVMLGEYSFDGDTDTAWYCEGKTDREIVYELGETATVKTAEVKWFAQSAPFEIYVSTDNVSFTLAAEGTAPETVGQKQTVNINKEAKYIKVVTKYNNVNYDHGISEISFTK